MSPRLVYKLVSGKKRSERSRGYTRFVNGTIQLFNFATVEINSAIYLMDRAAEFFFVFYVLSPMFYVF